MKLIVVATDGSPPAAEASRFGIELAREDDAELVFAHVVPEYDVVPATVMQIGGVFPHEPGPDDTALLEDAAALAAEQDVIATTVLLRGETVDAIVDYAVSHDADLVVVGSRGHGAIAGALLGSVSLGVLRRAARAATARSRGRCSAASRSGSCGGRASPWRSCGRERPQVCARSRSR